MQRRVTFVTVLFFFCFAALLVRLVQLQFFQHAFFLEKSLAQRTRVVTAAPNRGDIYDRQGKLLATSVQAASVFVNPRVVTSEALAGLARILGHSQATLARKVERNQSRSFLWVERKITSQQANVLRARAWPGVGLVPEEKRVYPKGMLAAHVLGFVGIDNQGLSGLELSYDAVLKGREGKLVMESDPSGRAIFLDKLHVLTRPTDGVDIVLTIDEAIQYRAEEVLEATLAKHRARAGAILVMDVETGALYALAARPAFDPNVYWTSPETSWIPSPVASLYEPGSTFKVITIAAGLDLGVITPTMRFHCPKTIKLGDRVIRNAHEIWGETEHLPVREILAQSLNTGTVKIGLTIGPKGLSEYFQRFGFGARTGVELPGESPGLVKALGTWDEPDIGMMTFGQSIAVTPLQLLTAIAAIGNDGVLVKPHLVKRILSPALQFEKTQVKKEVRSVVRPEVARSLLEMMEHAVSDGTGKAARMVGYRVAGKTGTAEKPAKHGGYVKGEYVASFVGLVPAAAPRLAVLVVVDAPQGVYWGGHVAGPAFQNVTRYALQRLGVAPTE